MKIASSVIAVHLLVIVALMYFQTPRFKTQQRAPIAVRTFVQKSVPLAQPEPLVQVETPKPEPAAPVIEKVKPIESKTQNAPKKTTAAPSTEKSQPKKNASKPAVNKEPSKNTAQHQKLISLMQESLNKLHTTSASGIAKQSEKTIEPLASETLSFEVKYEEELIDYLQALLSLPEKGEVKLKLTLKKDGTVQKMAITQASSEKNRAYIESNLITCSFPAFGSRFKGETTHTFTLTLTSTR